ncbi:MAG: metal-dependent hydrolase, partial [Anaerolineales bacterium]|nr:metal-dependent hydrolase [Anaerolineales bacterium]
GRHDLDLAILCVGDNFTMGPDDSLIALDFLKPKAVIPCHYNTWPPISIDADAWKAGVSAETTAEPIVLQPEESYTL